MSEKIKAVLEEELIFGARDREERWRKIAYAASGFGILGCALAALMALSIDKPPPVLIPFDPSTGTALPMVNVGTISVTQQEAVVQSLVAAYVRDREIYNQLDNDVRIESVFARSSGQARTSLQQLWNPENPEFPNKVYGDNERMDIQILSISDIGQNRAQARVTKRLITKDGMTEGSFRITIAYEFDPSTLRDLAGIWANPFGFSVTQYSVASERFQ